MTRKKTRLRRKKDSALSHDPDYTRVSSCAGYFEIWEKWTLAGLSVALLFLSAKLGGKGALNLKGFHIPASYFYNVCGTILFATCFGDFIAIYRISKLIDKLDAEDLNRIRIHSSMWNFLADFGPSFFDRIQSCLTIGCLVIAWWVCYSAVSVLNPYRWSFGFELMLLGTSSLCLCTIGRCESAMRRAYSGVNKPCFTLPVVGAVTVQDIVVAVALAIGGSIALAVQTLA